MKIGLITTMFEQYKSVTYNELAKRYVEKGHEVHVIGKREKNQLYYEEKNGIMIHRVNIPSFPGSVTLFPIFAKKTLQKLDGYVDIFDLHDFHGFGLRKIIKKPYVVQMPSTLIESAEKLRSIALHDSSIRSLISRYVFLPIVMAKSQAYACKGAKVIIAICENTKKGIIDDYQVNEEKIKVIPAGVDINRFNPNNSGKTLRNELNIDDKKVILCMGKVTYLKGIHYLIKAFKRISGRYKNVVLIIVGSGTEVKKYRDLVVSYDLKERVVFTGRVNYNDVPFFHAASDIFVHPSLVEGTPIVILEAMATGKPVIATNVGGIPEMITDGVDGFIVEEKNVGQIAKKLSLLLGDEKVCKKIGKNARKKVEKKFNWDIIAERILDVYEGVSENRND